MDDYDARIRHTNWASRLQANGYLPATLLLAALSTLAAVCGVLFIPFCSQHSVLFSIALSVLLFFVLLLFRKVILEHSDQRRVVEEEALFEYFVQQNAGSNGEEEIATELLENALQLKTVRAHDCMAPRPEIIYVDVNASVEELRQVFIESSLSRVLITEGELDHVLGYVHVQQLFARPARIRDMVLPISFVPETIFINALLNKFIKSRTSIACVVDEYGSLAGLVTLEDALEQLFGEIDDEHDQEEFIEAQVSPDEFLFSGRLRVDYLNEKYPELALPSGEYHTLSGYLVTTTETIPEQGARLELEGKTFILELVSDRKIETVRVLI